MRKIKNFFLGVIIYNIFFPNRAGSQLPLSILNARLDLYGHYMGASFAKEIARRTSERYRHKFVSILKSGLFVGLSLCCLYFLQFIPANSYYYGLSQELVASLIFFFLLLYVIPKQISKEHEVKIGMSYFTVEDGTNPVELSFYLTNLGSRAIQPDDVHCELLCDDRVVIMKPAPDSLVRNFTPAQECDLHHISVKLDEILFPGQRQLVLKVNTLERLVVLYYRIFTNDKIIPDFSKTTPNIFIQNEDKTLPDIEEYGEIIVNLDEIESFREYSVR